MTNPQQEWKCCTSKIGPVCLHRCGFIGSIKASKRDYTVTLTPHQNIVVVAGAGREWRWPLSEYQPLDPAHSVLFQRVSTLLERANLVPIS